MPRGRHRARHGRFDRPDAAFPPLLSFRGREVRVPRSLSQTRQPTAHAKRDSACAPTPRTILGGETKLIGERKGDERRDLLYGLSAGLPIGSSSSIKLAYVASRSDEDVGKDTDSYALGYSIRF